MSAQKRPKIVGRPFQKGNCANPGGRPKIPDEFKTHTKEAVLRLMHWMRSDNPKASMQATALFLAYGLGKPTEHIEHSGSLSLENLLGETHA